MVLMVVVVALIVVKEVLRVEVVVIEKHTN